MPLPTPCVKAFTRKQWIFRVKAHFSRFRHLYTKSTTDCLRENNLNRSGCVIMTPWTWPWQWDVNSQFTLNYIYFLPYLHAGQSPQPRPLELAHPSLSLSRSGYGRNMLWLLSPKRPYFPSQWKWGEMWLLLKSHLGTGAEYGERGICAALAAPGSWRVSQTLIMQHMQGSLA